MARDLRMGNQHTLQGYAMVQHSHAYCAKTLFRTRRPQRGGAVTIELIVVLPVLLVAVLGIGQFGFYFQRVEQLMLATRVGAEAASQTAGLPASGLVPTSIADAINHQLASANISTVAIIVEHNIPGPGENVLRTDSVPNTCPEPISVLPVSSVRVTVCVPLADLMPNCLSFFGFDISTRNAVHTTTFGYEL